MDGCQLHPPVFSKFSDFKLVVTRSHIQGAGEGVINHGPEIPEGVLFGPYTGKFYSADVHKKMPDSGNAWRIFNPSNGRTAGFIDPGVVEDAIGAKRLGQPTLNLIARVEGGLCRPTTRGSYSPTPRAPNH